MSSQLELECASVFRMNSRDTLQSFFAFLNHVGRAATNDNLGQVDVTRWEIVIKTVGGEALIESIGLVLSEGVLKLSVDIPRLKQGLTIVEEQWAKHVATVLDPASGQALQTLQNVTPQAKFTRDFLDSWSGVGGAFWWGSCRGHYSIGKRLFSLASLGCMIWILAALGGFSGVLEVRPHEKEVDTMQHACSIELDISIPDASLVVTNDGRGGVILTTEPPMEKVRIPLPKSCLPFARALSQYLFNPNRFEKDDKVTEFQFTSFLFDPGYTSLWLMARGSDEVFAFASSKPDLALVEFDLVHTASDWLRDLPNDSALATVWPKNACMVFYKDGKWIAEIVHPVSKPHFEDWSRVMQVPPIGAPWKRSFSEIFAPGNGTVTNSTFSLDNFQDSSFSTFLLGASMLKLGPYLLFLGFAGLVYLISMCFTCCCCCGSVGSQWPRVFSSLLTFNALVYSVSLLRNIYGGLLIATILWYAQRQNSAKIVFGLSVILVLLDRFAGHWLCFIGRVTACIILMFHNADRK